MMICYLVTKNSHILLAESMQILLVDTVTNWSCRMPFFYWWIENIVAWFIADSVFSLIIALRSKLLLHEQEHTLMSIHIIKYNSQIL